MKKEKISKIIGFILITISLIFILEKLWVNRKCIISWQFNSEQILIILLSILVYAFLGILLSFAWCKLLHYFGQKNINFMQCLKIYSRTQIAKYIPGNIFHFVSRHFAGRILKIKNNSLILATIYEIIGTITAAATFALLGIVFWEINQQKESFTLITILVFFIVLLLPILFYKIINSFKKFEKIRLVYKNPIANYKILVPVYLLYFLFFIIAGGIFFLIINTAIPFTNLNQLGLIITIFSLSWVAGLITPGAPGGLGVREAVIVASLSNLLGEPKSLFMAILFRLITISGDLLFFLSSYLIDLKKSSR